MSQAALIRPTHLQRMAVVYVRQSTPKQVLQNQESTRRQYQLAERAAALGWPPPRILTIDDDLGQSGASSTTRVGFQRLVTSITLGEVGLVLVTEVSRLSRLNSDWHRVLELCAVFETLLADDDGVYDLRDPNDRLVLGLKGTLFAAELHILRARMRAGLLNKAQRGALALRLPVGYRRLHDGSVVLDPDEQVRTTLQTLFTLFAQLQNARAVQRAFTQQGLLMPRYVQSGWDFGQLRWVRPSYQMIEQVLISPVYAGTFVYGRRTRQILPGDPPQTLLHRLPQDQWEIVVPDIYPAYISAETYAANRETLRHNLYNFTQRHPGAPREGTALLAGLILCGRCGRHMSVSYGSDYASYLCRSAQMRYHEPLCQSFPQGLLDATIRTIFLHAVAPAQIETLLTALDTLEQERQATARHWQLRRERARYGVRLAERQYDAVDPENRLVARELETRWNAALAAQEEVEREYAVAQRTTLAPLDAQEQQAVRQLAADLPSLWDAPTTTVTDHKRLLRVVVQEVTVTVVAASPRQATLEVLWSGGVRTTHMATCPRIGWHCTTDAALLTRLRALAEQLPDHQIAEILTTEGLRTQTGKEWTYRRVTSIRKQHGIPTGCPLDPSMGTPRGDGRVSIATAAQRLGVSPSLVHVWITQGALACDQRIPGSYCWVLLTEDDVARLTGQSASEDFPLITEVMRQRRCTRDDVWGLVRAGRYVAYRRAVGQRWEWRLAPVAAPLPGVEQGVG